MSVLCAEAHHLSRGDMHGFGSGFAHQKVEEFDAGKSSSCHHSIVASSCTVRVEFARCQADNENYSL